jgi:IS30 family transposase
MQIHARATLTVKNRIEVKKLFQEQNLKISELARRFQVSPTTISRWVKRDSPLDKSSAPLNPRTVITEEYRQAVVSYRQEHPNHGSIRIADTLKKDFPQAKKSAVYNIIKQSGLIKKAAKKPKTVKHIPVGRHRIQMDIQTLPAVKGDKGREYKISMIHLATRVKYSEIHSNHQSETVLEVFRRSMDFLPPFFS